MTHVRTAKPELSANRVVDHRSCAGCPISSTPRCPRVAPYGLVMPLRGPNCRNRFLWRAEPPLRSSATALQVTLASGTAIGAEMAHPAQRRSLSQGDPLRAPGHGPEG